MPVAWRNVSWHALRSSDTNYGENDKRCDAYNSLKSRRIVPIILRCQPLSNSDWIAIDSIRFGIFFRFLMIKFAEVDLFWVGFMV